MQFGNPVSGFADFVWGSDAPRSHSDSNCLLIQSEGTCWGHDGWALTLIIGNGPGTLGQSQQTALCRHTSCSVPFLTQSFVSSVARFAFLRVWSIMDLLGAGWVSLFELAQREAESSWPAAPRFEDLGEIKEILRRIPVQHWQRISQSADLRMELAELAFRKRSARRFLD